MNKKQSAKRSTSKPPRKRTESKEKEIKRADVPPEVSKARKYAAYQMRLMNPHMTFAKITEKLNEMFPEFPLYSEHQAVEKMIKEAQKEYIDEHKAKIDEIKAESGAVLDWVRYEASEAWQRSQDLLKVIKKKEDQTVEQILKAEVGNAQFLKRITETVEVKTKIYGAQAPSKHELTGKNGVPLVPASLDFNKLAPFLSNDDLETLDQAAQIIERAQRDLAAAVDTGG